MNRKIKHSNRLLTPIWYSTGHVQAWQLSTPNTVSHSHAELCTSNMQYNTYKQAVNRVCIQYADYVTPESTIVSW